MAETGNPVAGILSRLESAIEQLPKEGYKASVAIGAVASTISLVESVGNLVSLIKCISASKGTCSGNGIRKCDPTCARIYLEETGGEIIVHKAKSNVFSAKVSPGEVSVSRKGVRVSTNGVNITIALQAGDDYFEITVPLNDAEEIYKENYTIKYALKRVAAAIRVAVNDLRACAARNAIVC